MHTVMWTFKVPAGTSKAQLIETINATAHTYEGIPGLIRKILRDRARWPFAGRHLSLGKQGRRQRILHGRLGGDGDQALGGATAATGMGDAHGGGERGAAPRCGRVRRGHPIVKSRVSSVVEQRFCKPLVGSSILSPGTVRSGASCKSSSQRPREGRSPLPTRDCGLPQHLEEKESPDA